ncbi:MAG TPA: response regulator [Roseiflexaceae bacterium]|nr:response regulator [Roseiflexaceae bacterium]
MIENDIATRDFMQDILSDEGHEVHCCAWAGATVEIVARAQPQIVIVDLNPIDPDSAVAFLKQFRQHHDTQQASVLISCTSTHLLNRLHDQLQRLECATMLKPFELDDFLNHVDTLCADPQTRCATA